jgi:PAS domain S-box-containing protein
MTVTDANDLIISVNPAFEQTTGYRAEEVIGKNPRVLSSGRQDKAFYQAMWRSLQASGHWSGEIWNRRKNGEVYLEQLTINTTFNQKWYGQPPCGAVFPTLPSARKPRS